MKPRLLGVSLIILAVLGLLNLYQALTRASGSDESHHAAAFAMAEADASEFDFKFDFDFDFDFDHEIADAADHVAMLASEGAGERMIDRTFRVSNGDDLLIDVQHSDIRVETGTGSEAHIIVTLTSRDMDDAKAMFERMDYRVEQEGDVIAVRSNMPRRTNWRTRMQIEVVAVIPARFDVRISSTHGDVVVDDLEGDLTLDTTHGDVVLGSVAGQKVLVASTHGDVAAGSLQAPRVEVNTTHGDIGLERVSSKAFEATTTHSDIAIGRLTGPANISTTHGDVDVQVEGNDGLEIRTTHGNVLMTVPSKISANLDLRGDRVELPRNSKFSGEIKKKSAEGSLNGGGARIDVATTFGDVVIRSN